MRDEDDGDPAAVQPVEQIHDVHAGLGVESARGFVGQNQDRLVGQRAGDGHALLLSAGKLRRVVTQAVFKPHGRQRRPGAIMALRPRHAAVAQRKLDVFNGRRSREQVEALEYEADLPIANLGQLVRRQVRDIPAIQDIASGRGRVQAAEEVHERGLSRSRRTRHRDKIAAPDFNRYRAQRMDHFAADPIVFGEILGFKQDVGHSS